MSTLVQLRAEVRDAVFERSTDTGLIPDVTSLDRWISRANQSIWSLGVERNPDAWVERSGDLSVPVDGIAYTAISAGGVKQVKACWRRMPDGQYAYLWPLEEVNEHLPADESQVGSTDPEYRWYIEGNKVRLTPVPSVAQTCRFKFIAVPAELAVANETAEALGGRYPEHHGLVALRAAQMLYRKDEEKTTPWDGAVAELKDLFVRALQRSQGHRTRRILKRRAYP